MTSTSPRTPTRTESLGAAHSPRRGWLWMLVGIVVLVGAAMVALWLLPTTTIDQTETLEGPVTHLSIDATGTVSLEAGERTELIITKEWVFSGEPTVDLTREDGVVRLVAECPWFQIKCTTRVAGTVASDAQIEVRTAAGSIDVTGTTNGVDLETSAGSVRAQDVAGASRLITSAGDVIGKVGDGDVEARTSTGRIELTALGEFSSLSAVTSAGSVDLTVPDDTYDVDADTSAGSVNVGVRTDSTSERRIVAESSAGSITIRPAP